MYKAPPGISDREFLLKRKRKDNYPEEGLTTIHYKSTEHPMMPLVPGRVRAKTLLNGNILRPDCDINGKPITHICLMI
jgi:hypothetical protein